VSTSTLPTNTTLLFTVPSTTVTRTKTVTCLRDDYRHHHHQRHVFKRPHWIPSDD
jgi:hypothetical protein